MRQTVSMSAACNRIHESPLQRGTCDWHGSSLHLRGAQVVRQDDDKRRARRSARRARSMRAAFQEGPRLHRSLVARRAPAAGPATISTSTHRPSQRLALCSAAMPSVPILRSSRATRGFTTGLTRRAATPARRSPNSSERRLFLLSTRPESPAAWRRSCLVTGSSTATWRSAA